MPKYVDPEEDFSSRKLVRDVKVFDPELGERVRLEAGTYVPEHLAKKVTNPALFEPEHEDEEVIPLKKMTVQALRDLAEEEEIDISSVTRKKDIIELIEKSRGSDE